MASSGLLACCSSTNEDYTNQLALSAALRGLSGTVVVSHVKVANHSAFADAAAQAENVRWETHVGIMVIISVISWFFRAHLVNLSMSYPEFGVYLGLGFAPARARDATRVTRPAIESDAFLSKR